MDASFESLCSPQAFGMHQSEQSESRPNFLSAIKSLHQSLRKPLRLKPRSNYGGSAQSSQSSVDLSRGPSRSNSDTIPTDYYEAPRRQGFAPDMDDYLSLDQLEGLWQYQDSYVGPVATPLTSSTFSFQEAVEAPTFVQHKRPDNVIVPPSNNAQNLGITGSDEALVVDGHLHPAMRSTPNLSHSSVVSEPERSTLLLPPSPPAPALRQSSLPPPVTGSRRASPPPTPRQSSPSLPSASDADQPSPPLPVSEANQTPLPTEPIARARTPNTNDFPRLSAIGKPLVSKDGKPIISKMAKPVPIPAERMAPSWTQRRQFLREVPGLI